MIYAGVVLAWALSIGGAFWYGTGVGRNSLQAEQAREAEVQAATLQVAQSVLAAELAKLDSSIGVINGKLNAAMRTSKQYTECKHSPDVMQYIKEAFGAGANSNAAGEMRSSSGSSNR